MAYLDGYKYDIFVSYAHNSAEQEFIDDKGRGWTQAVIDHLKHQINYRLDIKYESDGVETWMDPQLARNKPLTGEIRSHVQQSALLLVFHGKFYARSTWCGDEANWFSESIKDRQRSDSRIFIVRKDSSKDPSWFNKFQDERGYPLKGYTFYQKAEPEKAEKPLGWPIAKMENDKYCAALSTVADGLASELKDLKGIEQDRKGSKGETSPKRESTDGKRTIFLACSTETLASQRYRVAQTLKDKGFNVLPEDDVVENPSTRSTEVLQNCKECRCFVQLLDGRSGSFIPGKDGYVTRQYRVAEEKGLRIFQWIDPKVDIDSIEDHKYKQFLRSLAAESFESLDGFVEHVCYAIESTDWPRFVPSADLVIRAEKSDYRFAADYIHPAVMAAGALGELPNLELLPSEGDAP